MTAIDVDAIRLAFQLGGDPAVLALVGEGESQRVRELHANIATTSSAPQWTCPVLLLFCAQWWNDLHPEDRWLVLSVMPRVAGATVNETLASQRAWRCLDWLVRTHAPAWLSLTPSLCQHAERLRAMPPVTKRMLAKSQPHLAAARDAARAAAWAAARAAARDAAWAAAWAAARDAAGAAARDALAPTVRALQLSALGLVVEMAGYR